MSLNQQQEVKKLQQSTKSPENVIVTDIGENQTAKSPRTYRIFRQRSPTRNEATFSPPPKLLATGGTVQSTISYVNTSRQRSPQGCTIYYKQGYGINRPEISSFQNSLSPEKLKLVKSTQMLEYQNGLLSKQLQQRDDIIKMFKRGWNPSTEPINDGVIKNLNLKLAQKNTLIEQIHRNLSQFEQIVNKQKLQISPVCMQRFKILQQLVFRHEHYPIIIRQRIIDTSKNAEKVFIREQTSLQQWQIKMQKSYRQLSTVRQKLDWFERQNRILQSTIAGLKAQKDVTGKQDPNILKVQIQKLNNQIIILQQQVSNYKHQINQLTININQIHNSYKIKLDEKNSNSDEVNRLNNEIKILKEAACRYGEKDRQILGLRQQVEKLVKQISIIGEKQSQYLNEIKMLKCQNNQLKSKLVNNNVQSQLKLQIEQITKNSNLRISELDKELQVSYLKIKDFQRQNKLLLDQANNWKKHLSEAQTYIQKLLIEIQGLKQQLSKSKISTTESQMLTSENSQLKMQISELQINISKIISQRDREIDERKRSMAELQQLRAQVRDLSSRIDVLLCERDGQASKWQAILNQKITEHTSSIQQIEIRIRRESEGTIKNLRAEIENLKNQISVLNKCRSDEASKLRQEYEQKMAVLKREADGLRIQIINLRNQKSSRDWEKEIEVIKLEYQNKIKDIWAKLTQAQSFIINLSIKLQNAQQVIQGQKLQLIQLRNRSDPDQYKYKMDEKYDLILKKLMGLSAKNRQSISKESQFWQSYRLKRKSDLEQMQSAINETLSTLSSVDQTIIIRRSELFRLDLLKLEQLVHQIEKIKQGKVTVDISLRQNIETRFYGLLKSVATPIHQ